MGAVRPAHQGKPRKKLEDVAAALYRPKPKGADGGFGNVRMSEKAAKRMQMQQVAADEIGVWPENWQSVNFFMDYCRTQWRTGMGGSTGLDYTAVLACLRTLRLGRERTDEVFADVRVLEAAALEAMIAK